MLCSCHCLPGPCPQAGYVMLGLSFGNKLTHMATCKTHSSTHVISCIKHQLARLTSDMGSSAVSV